MELRSSSELLKQHDCFEKRKPVAKPLRPEFYFSARETRQPPVVLYQIFGPREMEIVSLDKLVFVGGIVSFLETKVWAGLSKNLLNSNMF